MSACSQCGTVAKPTDKFCNVCGTPLAQQPGPPAAAPAASPYAAPPQPYGSPQGPPGGYAPAPPGYSQGAAAIARCQMGHDISPGASYCAQGHPIALDQMQFGGGGGGQGAPAYGHAAGPQYAPTPLPGGAYSPSPAGFGVPPAAPQQGYAPPPPQYAPAPGFGSPGAAFGAAQPSAGPYPGSPPLAAAQPQGFPEAPREGAPARVLRGFVVAYGTNAVGDYWALTGGRHIVGRLGSGDGVEVALQDPTISSRHAAFVVDGNACTISIEDTGSTNGTFVNDEHIGFNGRRDLRDGDRVRFGGFTTIVKLIGRV
jgi:hypothetical protein